MTIVQVEEGRSLFAEQDRCSVTLGLGQVRVEFAGLDKLTDLAWLLHGSHVSAIGSDGGEVSISRNPSTRQVTLREGQGVEECELSIPKFQRFAEDAASDITHARACLVTRPIIDDPDD